MSRSARTDSSAAASFAEPRNAAPVPSCSSFPSQRIQQPRPGSPRAPAPDAEPLPRRRSTASAPARLSRKRQFPRCHLIEHHQTQSKQVPSAHRALRRAPAPQPCTSEFPSRHWLPSDPPRRPSSRSPKVQHLHSVPRHYLDVAGFQIPMHDAMRVSFRERRGDLRPITRHVLDRQRTLLDLLPHRGALQQFHHQVIRSHVVQRADMRMIERWKSPRPHAQIVR